MDIETSVIYLSQIVEITNTINWGTFSWIHEPKILPPSLPTPGNIWQKVMVWVATIISLWYYKSQALFIIAWLHCKGKQLLPDTCLQQQKSQICSAPGELLLQKTKTNLWHWHNQIHHIYQWSLHLLLPLTVSCRF